MTSNDVFLLALMPFALCAISCVVAMLCRGRLGIILTLVAVVVSLLGLAFLVLDAGGAIRCGSGAGAFGWPYPPSLDQAGGTGNYACRHLQLRNFWIGTSVLAVGVLVAITGLVVAFRPRRKTVRSSS